MIAALLLMIAGLHTTWGQGFRVYKSDGTIAQFSLRTDSIVFYDGIGSDVDFGPFTPVNQMIAGKWYMSYSETVTFNEDGTTDYMSGSNNPSGFIYEFLPYQGTLIFYNADGKIVNLLRVPKVTKDYAVLSEWGGEAFVVLTRTQPAQQLVTDICLSETSISLQPGETSTLTAIVLPANADNSAVTWESSNEAVAEVNNIGVVTANANGTCVIICRATDGSGVTAECQVRVKKADTMESVDLGLPSGTLWATCNVGASSPEEYGDYFAWGETTQKSEYNWRNYKHCNGSYNTLTKYCVHSDEGYNGYTDNLAELLPEDDAATANWGSNWQMPSYEQMQELVNSEYTTTKWTTLNGVDGYKITGKNGKSIFLPVAGCYGNVNSGISAVGEVGHYWSRSIGRVYSYDARSLYFHSESIGTNTDGRSCGFSVRPVRVD